jgi:ParB-like chromosome segregation protein Spo0J
MGENELRGANKLENFTIETVKRQDIQGADYNPRKITDSARKKLKDGLKKWGMVQPIVVNKRTMTIVGGHQRIEAMDSLMRTSDYELSCAMVDLDEKDEVSLNVFLNNAAAQGEWDILALKDIGDIFPDIDFETDLGFDESDIAVMFGKQEKIQEAIEEQEKAQEFTTDTFREAKKKSRQKAKAENEEGGSYNLADSDYVVQIVFNNNQEKHDFMRKIHKDPKEIYLKSTVLYDIASGKLDISVFAERE